MCPYVPRKSHQVVQPIFYVRVLLTNSIPVLTCVSPHLLKQTWPPLKVKGAFTADALNHVSCEVGPP